MTTPSCPVCDSTDVVRVDQPAGRWLCGECSTLLNGGGIEALAMRPRHNEYVDRRDNPRPPLPMQRYRPIRRPSELAKETERNSQ